MYDEWMKNHIIMIVHRCHSDLGVDCRRNNTVTLISALLVSQKLDGQAAYVVPNIPSKTGTIPISDLTGVHVLYLVYE